MLLSSILQGKGYELIPILASQPQETPTNVQLDTLDSRAYSVARPRGSSISRLSYEARLGCCLGLVF